MGALQKRIAFVGMTKQSGKGTAAVSPYLVGLGLRGGGVFDPGLEQESDAITYTTRISPDENRTAINPGAAFDTRLYPKSGALLAYAALGGITSTPGSPNTHVIVPASTLPYLTLASQLDTEYQKLVDCKCDELTIQWSERQPVEVSAVFKGITWTGYTASWTATNDESAAVKFSPPGGTFQLDAASGSPANAAITGGMISIKNNLVPIPLSKAIVPDDVFEAEQTIEVSFTLMPADTTEFRKALTGSGAGTAFTGVPVFGSFDVKYIIDANNDFDFTGTRTAFFPTYPDADPAGGPAELTMVGRVKKPAGAALTITVHNAIAGY
jgi:hypothetical protein